jgi:ABC-2 type transport system permease protein
VARRNSFIELVKGRLREFKREPSAMFFVVLMPIIWMVILGFAFSENRPERFGVGWDKDNDLSVAIMPGKFKAALELDKRVNLHSASLAELHKKIKRGQIVLTLRFDGSTASYIHDQANPDSIRAKSVVNDIVQRTAGRKDAMLTKDEEITIPGTRYVDFLVPGLLALSIMTSSLFGTGMTIVSNRRESLLKRYMVTPMRPYEYILSHIVGRGFVLLVEIAVILFAGWLLFDFKVLGSLVTFIGFAAIGTAAFTALALLCGARTNNTAAMNGITNLISLPMMLLCGIWFARENFPGWLIQVTDYLPLAPLVDGLRRIALEGAGISELGPYMLVLSSYFLGCTVLCKKLFRWY